MLRVNQSTGERVNIREIKQALPNLSFGEQSDLSTHGYPTLEETTKPVPGADEYVREGDPEEYAPGKWRQTWVVEPVPPPPVPQQIKRLQGIIAIDHASRGLVPALTDAEGNSVVPTLRDDVQAWRNDPARTLVELAYWEHPYWHRDDPIINSWGLPDAVLDALFTYGAAQ